jgi:hypothetical protein
MAISKSRWRRSATIGAVFVALGAGTLALAPSASATTSTVTASYTCTATKSGLSSSGTESIAVTAPATAHVGDTVPISVAIAYSTITSPIDATTSGYQDFVYGNGWADFGFFRVSSPTYTLTSGHAIPDATLTGSLHVTTTGTYGIGPVDGGIAAIINGVEHDASCSITTGSSAVATIVVS